MKLVEARTADDADIVQDHRPAPSHELLDKLGLIPEDDLLNLADITENTSEMWQRRRTGPPRIRIGKRFYYPLDGVLLFIREKLDQ